MNEIRVEADRERHIGTIALARAHKSNAMTIDMVAEFTSALWELEQDDDIKVIVIRGEGADLSVGLDVTEAQAIYQRKTARRIPSQRARFAAHHDLWWGPDGMFHRLLHCRKITVAAANGRCFGIGLYLCLCSDLVVCEDGARFAQPRWRHLGVEGDVSMLVAAVGWKRANELMFCGEAWSAQQAFSYGLVDQVVDGEALLQAVSKLAGNCAMIMRDGIAAEKQIVFAALERMQIGTGFAAAAVLGGWASNIHHRPGEFNFFRALRDEGAPGAMARSNEYFAGDE
jgi:enoyl-CoA hydratase